MSSRFWPYQMLNSTDWKAFRMRQCGLSLDAPGIPQLRRDHRGANVGLGHGWGNAISARIPGHSIATSYSSGKDVHQGLHWQRSSPQSKDRTKASPDTWNKDPSGWQKPQTPSRVTYQLRASEEATHGSIVMTSKETSNHCEPRVIVLRVELRWDGYG